MSTGQDDLLPIHGFVLAGGRSSRMGQDKAMLLFQGRPMVGRALQTLRAVCVEVSIAGNREDLRTLAPVVREGRERAGPAAGIEAGLRAASEPWTMFIPVDVPLVAPDLLRSWAAAVCERHAAGVRLSFLRVDGQRQPPFCMLHPACLEPLHQALDVGQRRLEDVFTQTAAALGPAALWVCDAEAFFGRATGPGLDIAAMFSNVNTPEDLAALERKAPQLDAGVAY